MTPYEVPQELIDILDERAGKKHSRQGPVVCALAEILTRHDVMRAEAGWRFVRTVPLGPPDDYAGADIDDSLFWHSESQRLAHIVEEWRL